jgi:hypothetical protein
MCQLQFIVRLHSPDHSQLCHLLCAACFQLAAETVEEANSWVKAIRTAIRKSKIKKSLSVPLDDAMLSICPFKSITGMSRWQKSNVRRELDAWQSLREHTLKIDISKYGRDDIVIRGILALRTVDDTGGEQRSDYVDEDGDVDSYSSGTKYVFALTADAAVRWYGPSSSDDDIELNVNSDLRDLSLVGSLSLWQADDKQVSIGDLDIKNAHVLALRSRFDLGVPERYTASDAGPVKYSLQAPTLDEAGDWIESMKAVQVLSMLRAREREEEMRLRLEEERILYQRYLAEQQRVFGLEDKALVKKGVLYRRDRSVAASSFPGRAVPGTVAAVTTVMSATAGSTSEGEASASDDTGYFDDEGVFWRPYTFVIQGGQLYQQTSYGDGPADAETSAGPAIDIADLSSNPICTDDADQTARSDRVTFSMRTVSDGVTHSFAVATPEEFAEWYLTLEVVHEYELQRLQSLGHSIGSLSVSPVLAAKTSSAAMGTKALSERATPFVPSITPTKKEAPGPAAETCYSFLPDVVTTLASPVSPDSTPVKVVPVDVPVIDWADSADSHDDDARTTVVVDAQAATATATATAAAADGAKSGSMSKTSRIGELVDKFGGKVSSTARSKREVSDQASVPVVDVFSPPKVKGNNKSKGKDGTDKAVEI